MHLIGRVTLHLSSATILCFEGGLIAINFTLDLFASNLNKTIESWQ